MTDQDRSDLEEAIRLLSALINGTVLPSTRECIEAVLARHPEKPKLLGCPWCGGEPEIANPLKNSAMRRWYCHNCQVYGPWGTDDADAAASWNRRATPASGPLSGGKGE